MLINKIHVLYLRMRLTTCHRTMADSSQEPHRPGPWKQKNKLHKHGKHKSKSDTMSVNKGNCHKREFTHGNNIIYQIYHEGRVCLKKHKTKASKELLKRDRRNQVGKIYC